MKIGKTVLLAVGIALIASGCARKAPKIFKIDNPRVTVPAIDNPDVDSAIARLPGEISLRCPARSGRWEAAIDRKISMRSTTLAKTEITGVAGLSLAVGEATPEGDSFVTPFKVMGVNTSVTALQNQEETGRHMASALDGLAFDFVAGPGTACEIRSSKVVPPEILETFPAMLPVLPDVATMRSGSWPISRTRNVTLPGGATAVEQVAGTARIAGVSSGDAIFLFDWTSETKGTSDSEGVRGIITGGAGAGRAVCRFNPSGLKSCEVSESRTHSVTLSPDVGKPRLLEQKVSIDSTFAREP